jgi:hypothetical protein
MVIEFKIQLDDAATARAFTAQAVTNPNLPAQKLLPAAFHTPAAAAPAASAKGGAAPQEPPTDAPASDVGTGSPSAVIPSIPGSGMVFVLGPIVVCGSGPGHSVPGHSGLGNSGLGGDAPASDLGTAKKPPRP